MLEVTINGETHSFADGTTIGQMLETLEMLEMLRQEWCKAANDWHSSDTLGRRR